MRVNVYAEEISERIEIVEKRGEKGQVFYGVRFYTELPVTLAGVPVGNFKTQVQGPFIHCEGDDDSAAVTFWSLPRTKRILRQALQKIDEVLERREL